MCSRHNCLYYTTVIALLRRTLLPHTASHQPHAQRLLPLCHERWGYVARRYQRQVSSLAILQTPPSQRKSVQGHAMRCAVATKLTCLAYSSRRLPIVRQLRLDQYCAHSANDGDSEKSHSSLGACSHAAKNAIHAPNEKPARIVSAESYRRYRSCSVCNHCFCIVQCHWIGTNSTA